MQTPKESSSSSQTQYHLELGGLKPLSLHPKQEEDQPPLDSWKMYSPTSTSSLIGHCIGMESCVDFRYDEEIRTAAMDDGNVDEDRKTRRDQRLEARNNRTKKEFPPPIPYLARTGNLPSHMPWVFKRYYTDDGRLVIREEKVKRHEYFRAHRSNGRLTLHLVPLDDDVLDHHVTAGDDDVEEEVDDVDFDDDNDVKEEEVVLVDDQTVVGVEESTVVVDDRKVVGVEESRAVMGVEESRAVVGVEESRAVVGVSISPENGINGGGGKRGGGGKCIEYKSMRTSTCCMFGMQLPSHIRPVHI